MLNFFLTVIYRDGHKRNFNYDTLSEAWSKLPEFATKKDVTRVQLGVYLADTGTIRHK